MSTRTIKLVVVGAMVAGTLVAESHKEWHFNVGPKAGVSVNNPYGSISVKPSTNNTVVINAVLHSDKVEVDNRQNGNRVDVQSHLLPGADATSGRVDYEVLVPADASVTLHSSTGPLRAEKLHGDVSLEGSGATVDVRDVAAGLILAMERGQVGHRYVLGGESIPLKKVLGLVADISGRRSCLIPVPGRLAEISTAMLELIADHVTRRPPSGTAEGVRIALRATALSIEKAQRELSYAPRPVEPALRETIAYLLGTGGHHREFSPAAMPAYSAISPQSPM